MFNQIINKAIMLERIRVSQHFYLDEFIDPTTYLKEKDHGLSKIDFRLFTIAESLRVIDGRPITINNWWNHYKELYNKGFSKFKIVSTIKLRNQDNLCRIYSGYRPIWCPIGAERSQHKKGAAIDPVDLQERLYKILVDHTGFFYGLGVRRVEDEKLTKSWLHIDVSVYNESKKGIRIVDYEKQTGLIEL